MKLLGEVDLDGVRVILSAVNVRRVARLAPSDGSNVRRVASGRYRGGPQRPR